MKILTRKEIEKSLDILKAIKSIEEGFILYSKNETVIPPVASLHFEHPPGECHIKYGYAKKGRYYIVKIASGFSENPRQGLPAGNGMMILFDKETGEPVSVLSDEGYLTDVRTAAAGSIAAKYFAPKKVSCIGIVGTGGQAYYQLKFLSYATPCTKVLVWGRNSEKVRKFIKHPHLREFQIEEAKDLRELASQCNLIVTTTSSTSPLLFHEDIRKGTHITAMGADDAGKQELDPQIFSKADRIIVDSKSQCSLFSDASFALKKGIIQEKEMTELGDAILHPSLRRTKEDQITTVSLTGVAIQDLQIAVSVYESHQRRN